MTHGIANMKRNETTTPPPVYQDADIDLPDEEEQEQEPEFPCDDPSGIYVP